MKSAPYSPGSKFSWDEGDLREVPTPPATPPPKRVDPPKPKPEPAADF